MDDGTTKPIATVKKGDKVEAADPDTGKHREGHTVTAALVNHDYDLIDVAFARPTAPSPPSTPPPSTLSGTTPATCGYPQGS